MTTKKLAFAAALAAALTLGHARADDATQAQDRTRDQTHAQAGDRGTAANDQDQTRARDGSGPSAARITLTRRRS